MPVSSPNTNTIPAALGGKVLEFNAKVRTGDLPRDVGALVQAVLREAYLENTKGLFDYASKVKFYNNLKKRIRKELTTQRQNLSTMAGRDANAAVPGGQINPQAFGENYVGTSEFNVRAPNESEPKDVAELFKSKFSALAADKDKFYALLKTAFGDSFDKTKAEALRQQVLKGDFSWLPHVEKVGADVLPNATGARATESGTIYLRDDIDHATTMATYIEEVGHHLDAEINDEDTEGDEGELFRRLVMGEVLTEDEINTIRAEDDSGTITIDGVDIDVEFSLWGDIKSAGRSIIKGAATVGGAAIGFAVGGIPGAIIGASVVNAAGNSGGDGGGGGGGGDGGGGGGDGDGGGGGGGDAAAGEPAASTAATAWNEGDPVRMKGHLEGYIESLESKLNSVGEDAQLAAVDLQNVLQKQQQTLQMMSNISKMLHDTSMAIIRKIGA